MPATSAVVSVLVLEALVLDSVELGAGVAKTVTVLHGVELVETGLAEDERKLLAHLQPNLSLMELRLLLAMVLLVDPKQVRIAEASPKPKGPMPQPQESRHHTAEPGRGTRKGRCPDSAVWVALWVSGVYCSQELRVALLSNFTAVVVDNLENPVVAAAWLIVSIGAAAGRWEGNGAPDDESETEPGVTAHSRLPFWLRS
ncbi:hypothetical protein F4821DRAFT_274940 [Hypoxylon rubiginosum]|uniref:Uncharacterized protein n=1 Tax=Hypoxylon rubiginosum TaxID=110542 RepID=A0ACC0CLP9_9PEZI|nr:hypothetical protein F4821DRAFT_274940 [Hypoxylon rubiginosum]